MPFSRARTLSVFTSRLTVSRSAKSRCSNVSCAGLDFRKIEHVVDDGQQTLGRAFRHVQVLALHRLQVGVEHQVGHAKHAVHRRADLVAHVREECAFRARRHLGGVLRVLQLFGSLVDEMFEMLLAGFQRLHAQAVAARKHEPERQHGERIEPSRLIDVRREINRIRVAGLVPDPVVVGGLHEKRVTARRNVAVVRRPAIAGIDPVAIVAFELVLEAHFFGRKKTQAGVTDCEVAASRLRVGLPGRSEHCAVNGHVFDVHGRERACWSKSFVGPPH